MILIFSPGTRQNRKNRRTYRNTATRRGITLLRAVATQTPLLYLRSWLRDLSLLPGALVCWFRRRLSLQRRMGHFFSNCSLTVAFDFFTTLRTGFQRRNDTFQMSIAVSSLEYLDY